MKRGQITLFVIIAILLVSAVGIVIYTQRERVGLMTPQINTEIRPINSFIENCIKSTGEDALIFTGQQGGYYNLPYNSIDSYVYYFHNNRSYFPQEEIVEQQISLYINEMLPFCTKNFIDFPDFYIEADSNAIKTKTTILQNKVIFFTEWPVSIKKGATTSILKEFSSQIDSRLNTIYAITANITDEQLKDPSSICLSCLTTLAIENDLYIDMENYDNAVLFTITDNNTLINNQPYKFIFANKY